MEQDKDFFKEIEEAVERNDNAFIVSELSGEHSADLIPLFYHLHHEDGAYVLKLMADEVKADVLIELDKEERKDILRHFTTQETASIIAYMDSDDAVDILNEQPVKIREEVIALLTDKEQADHIVDLLHYDDDCAGGLMAKELIKANINWTVRQCIEEIRRQAERVDKIMTIYVVDNDDVLVGRLSLKKLILSKDDTRVREIFIDKIETVQTYDDSETVADIMQKYDLESVPVVNLKGKLMGRITIDDIVDVITEQADLERQLMSGITENTEADDTVWMLSRARLPWLIIGMVGGLLGAQFIGFFEGDLVVVPAMAFFIPLITATGGNVGIQSSSVIVQSLAANDDVVITQGGAILKLLIVGTINGLTISSLVFLFNLIFIGYNLAFIVSLALFSVVILASFMGTITPIILNRVGINPALASGPFITTTNDLLGLAVYFMIARLLMDNI